MMLCVGTKNLFNSKSSRLAIKRFTKYQKSFIFVHAWSYISVVHVFTLYLLFASILAKIIMKKEENNNYTVM